MIIGIVTETYWPEINGVANTLYRIVNGLTQVGYTVQLICPQHPGRSPENMPPGVRLFGTRSVSMPGYNLVRIGFPSKRLLKEIWTQEKPDALYVATEGPLGWQAVKLARQFDIPVTSGFHTNFHSYSQHYRLGKLEGLAKRYLRHFHNKTERTLVPTYEQAKILRDMGVIDVSIMGRGVDTALYTPSKRSQAIRQSWGVKGHEPVLIYVGRLAQEKNLNLAIQAYFRLQAINPTLKFVLVGNGPLLEDLRHQHPEFIFAGVRTGEDLAAHYASADIFAFPSETETFGNVVLEAMASGLGILAYDYAAARIHIKPKENGLLAALGNEEEFLSHAEQLIQNSVLLRKIRINAAQYSQDHTWDAIVERFIQVLGIYPDHTNFYGLDKPSDLSNAV